jgi:stage II sporulation protein P
MKKINKSKKYVKIFKNLKYLLFVGIIYLSFDTTYGYLLSKKADEENIIYLRLALSESNHHFESNYEPKMFLNKAITFLSNIDLNKPTSILRFNNTINANGNKPAEVLPATHTDDYNLDEQEKITEFIKDPNPSNVTKPKVYIYNSHQLENYNAKDLELYNITPNVMMASYLLKEKLNDLGIGTIVNEFNLSEFIKANGWNHADSYKASRIFILDAKSNYSSLEYYIDIHRDAIKKDSGTIKIGGKNYAKILFVVGLENKSYEKNLNLANTLSEKTNKIYPGLSRGVIKKQGAGVNGVYNQDISPSSMLIEIGGYENTIEEVMCTVEALSKILYEYIEGAQ